MYLFPMPLISSCQMNQHLFFFVLPAQAYWKVIGQEQKLWAMQMEGLEHSGIFFL